MRNNVYKINKNPFFIVFPFLFPWPLFKSLKNNGEFMIMVYNKISLRYWVKGFYQLFIKLKIFKGYNFESVQKIFTDGYYHKHYNPRKLNQNLKYCSKPKTYMSSIHRWFLTPPWKSIIPLWRPEFFTWQKSLYFNHYSYIYRCFKSL